MIRDACHSSDAALDVALELVNLILPAELPREAFLLDGLFIGLEKAGGGAGPIAEPETCYCFAGGLRAADILAGHRRTIGPAAGGSGHTRRRGGCGERACVDAC